MKRSLTFAWITAVGLLLAPLSRGFAAQAQLALVLDASGSMWGQVEGENKIVIARRVLKEVLQSVPPTTGVGLVAYGHRDKSDCKDIETVVPYGSTDRGALLGQIAALNPKGKTPITATLTKVFAELRSREDATTVIFVSDGLETCGGDPCQAVRDAKAAGIKFVMHVVGFDLGKEGSVAQLECAAAAGDGLYLSADSGAELAAALNQAIEITPETPTGKLSLKATAEGKLVDVMVKVVNADGETVSAMRTYETADTNPRVMPLPDGKYDVVVEAVRISGRPTQRFSGIEIAAGKTVEKIVDFGTGTLRVKVTRNGKLSDATVSVLRAGTKEETTRGRSYRNDARNPWEARVVSGSYDIEIVSVEISNKSSKRWSGVELAGGATVALEHDFPSGILRVHAKRGAELVDVVLGVAEADSGTAVDAGRTYTKAATNPKSFDLAPGRYVVRARPIKKEYGAERKLEVTIVETNPVEWTVDFGSPQ